MTPQALKLVKMATHELINCNNAAEIYAHARTFLVRAHALKVAEERHQMNATYSHPIQHQTVQNPQRMLTQDYPGKKEEIVATKPSISLDLYDYNS